MWSRNCLPLRAGEFNPCFSGVRVRVVRCLVFCVVICRSLFVLLYVFLLATALSVLLPFTVSECHCGIFKGFFEKYIIHVQVLL